MEKDIERTDAEIKTNFSSKSQQVMKLGNLQEEKSGSSYFKAEAWQKYLQKVSSVRLESEQTALLLQLW